MISGLAPEGDGCVRRERGEGRREGRKEREGREEAVRLWYRAVSYALLFGGVAAGLLCFRACI